MIDTYLKSKNKSALDELSAFAVNVIGPTQGTAATPESVDTDGAVTPAQATQGDPAYWYACIRFYMPLAPYGEIEACSEEEGEAVCGVWA